jgi:alcohol dehydrogenase (cytochrome c)
MPKTCLGLLLVLLAMGASTAAAQAPDAGRLAFEGRCAGCHGGDGTGVGTTPSIVSPARSRATTAAALRDLIRTGIPGTGMPALTIPDGELDAVVAFVETLRARAGKPAAATPGGGRGAGAAPPRAVSVLMKDGRTITGVARYETLFDLGVHGSDGRFHSISKHQAATVTFGASPAAAARATVGAGVPFADIARPRSGEWPTYNGHLGGNRHSPLDEITTANVSRLAPKWTFPVPGQAQRSLQVTPLVIDGLMYVTAANEVWALDARTGREVWHFGRPRTPGLVGDPAAGLNRGVGVLGDRVFLQTDNAHVIALHRLTGELLWDVQMADSRDHYGSTGAPLVVNDLVIAGVSGGDEGIRGFLDAYRASTGERVWRFWTVPGPGEPGSETWGGKAVAHGCAATWLTGTYDPDARLLYWPTGNPCPDYNGAERQGDNLYSNSVIALDPDTGRLRWHFQFTPHDLNDWDATETPVLVDATFRGQPRKLLLHADRNGFFYVLDRITGEFLLAEPFIRNLTWASGIDAKGRPVRVAGQEPTPEGTRTCPAVTGATNWPSPSYNPATGLFYLMAAESCSVFTKNDQWFVQGQSFYGGSTRRSPSDVNTKYLRAIDIQTGNVAWEIPGLTGGVIASGVMTTAGGLLFFGDAAGGAFVAADAKDGRLLWHFDTGLGWKAGPMTYRVDGRQYIGIVAGSTVMAFGLP